MCFPNLLRQPVEVMVSVSGGVNTYRGSVAQGSVKPILYRLTDLLIAGKQKIGGVKSVVQAVLLIGYG